MFLTGMLLAPAAAYAQDMEDDWEKGVQLDAMIQPSKKELRKHLKKKMVEREIDSLIVSRDFKFEPVRLYSLKQPIFEFAKLIMLEKDNQALPKDPDMIPKNVLLLSPQDYVSIHNGWFETKLFHEWLPLDDHRIYGLSQRNPEQFKKMYDIPLSLPPVAHAFKFTQSVKEEDKTWFITIEVDRMSQKLKYEFVVQPTGWTVLRCTSNRWGNSVIYTGWLVRT